MNYQEFIAEVNKHREGKLNYLYGERNKPENYLPKDSLLDLMKQKKGLKTAQIAPAKTTLLGPNLESLPHMDLRGVGPKLKSVMNLRKFMDDTGRTPPKVP